MSEKERTVIDLTKPRYKVVADYPHIELDQHAVGDIISPYGMGFLHPEKVKEQYDSYPHLFRKIEWWEERQEDELPEYVKFPSGDVLKAYPLAYLDGKIYNDNVQDHWYMVHASPATHEEYEAFISNQNKNNG